MALAHDQVIVRVYTDESLDGEAAKGSDTRALCLLKCSSAGGKIDIHGDVMLSRQ